MSPDHDHSDQQRIIERFGAAVRRERIRKGLTQEQLAEAAELNIRTVQKIEAGKINLLMTTVYRLQAALGCPWEALLGRSGR